MVVPEIVIEAVEAVRRGEIIEAVLEGIFDVTVAEPDLVGPPPDLQIVAERGEDVVEDLPVAREQDVRAAEIEAVAVAYQAAAMAADGLVGLQHLA